MRSINNMKPNRLFFKVLLVLATATTGVAAEPSAVDLQALLDSLRLIQTDPAVRDAVGQRLGSDSKAAQSFDKLLTPSNSAENPAPDEIEFFESKVRPILAEHCLECHGPEKQKNDLRLDSRAAALKGGITGPAIVSGDPDQSLLLRALHHDGDIKMPPAGKLSDDQIGVLRHWIAIGAPWPKSAETVATTMEERIHEARKKHWAFQPVSEPPLPEVNDAAWVKTPIDRFVLSQLEKSGIKPSPIADRYTLIRRLTFDLTGLPPTSAEVDAFVRDEHLDAYEDLIDRLLASPRYGERWGRYWLDVARYADTRGYVFQSERAIPFSYTYRDYVIRAFNEDLPFDTFIKQQLAADQLELGDDKRPLAALGFLTLNRHFLGNIHDITDDRIDVATRGLMGLTVTCARCHDHKFDPITAKDYYALYGVFRSSTEPPELPLIAEPDATDPQYIDFQAALQTAEDDERALVKSLHVELLSHAREKVEAYLLAAFDTRDIADEEAFKTVARDRELRWQLVGRWRDYLKKKAEAHDPMFAPWLAFAALPAEGFAEKAAPLAAQFAENKTADRPINPRVAKAFEGAPPVSMGDIAARYATVLREVDVTWMNLLASESVLNPGGAVSATLPDANDEQLRAVLYAADSPANVSESDLLPMYDVPTQNRVRDKRNAIARVKATHAGRPDRAMALMDAEKPFDPHVFVRGNPGNKGDDVPRRFLALFSSSEPAPFVKGSGRLELADAIASKDNPLTARVWVNRVWLHHFDRGIVDTPSDFGVRTERPVHAELLDYLTTNFIRDGWSTKKLHKQILLSNTYRQQSLDVAKSRQLDPENRLFWRQNRRRLDFEALRDAVLAAAGTLDLATGGPSVDIVDPPYTTRRTIYSFIERQNLPGMFRTFDFANPDTHSPRRFQTTVPQQALFMMNSPFVIEQAKRLAARPEVMDLASTTERAGSLYQLIYQRTPDAEDTAVAERFITAQESIPSATTIVWQYGYGGVDEAAARVASFTPFPTFIPNSEWRIGEEMPDPQLRYLSLRANGGHPGADAQHAAIRRWNAPLDGTISISGTIKHAAEDAQGDGVLAHVVSSSAGVVWKGTVRNGEAHADVTSVTVHEGDTLDFVVACGESDGWDSFVWAPKVRYESGVTVGQVEWRAESDFSGPQPPALSPWERYAQVLLASNEFAFVD